MRSRTPRPLLDFLSGSDISQIGKHGGERLRAMADLHFLFDRGFAESASEGLVVEERIVSEAAGAARLADDAAFNRAAKNLHQFAVVDQGDDADESRAAVLDAAQAFEQKRVV